MDRDCDNCICKGIYELFMCPTKEKCIINRDWRPNLKELNRFADEQIAKQESHYIHKIPQWVQCKTCHLFFPKLNKNGDCDLCKAAKLNDPKPTLKKYLEERNNGV